MSTLVCHIQRIRTLRPDRDPPCEYCTVEYSPALAATVWAAIKLNIITYSTVVTSISLSLNDTVHIQYIMALPDRGLRLVVTLTVFG